MKRLVCIGLLVLMLLGMRIDETFASRIPGTPQLPTERKVYEI